MPKYDIICRVCEHKGEVQYGYADAMFCPICNSMQVYQDYTNKIVPHIWTDGKPD